MNNNNTKNEIIVDELPKCDFCNNRACYDMKIAVGGYWAYVCEEHRCFDKERISVDIHRRERMKIVDLSRLPDYRKQRFPGKTLQGDEDENQT